MRVGRRASIANDIIRKLFGADDDGAVKAKLIYIPLIVMFLFGIALVLMLARIGNI